MLVISAVHDGRRYPEFKYLYYSKREAIARYKERYGLKGKHGVIISIS